MMTEEFEQGWPVYAFVPKPVTSARIFVVSEIRVKVREHLSHLSRIINGHDAVAVAMEDINSKRPIVFCQFDDVAGVAGAKRGDSAA